jgi:hypothetical protein
MASFLWVYLLRESGKAKFIWKNLVNPVFKDQRCRVNYPSLFVPAFAETSEEGASCFIP